MAFLFMFVVQARIIPWTITNNIGVDDFSIKSHGEVKGQVSAITQKNTFKYSKFFFFITKCYQYEQKQMHT